MGAKKIIFMGEKPLGLKCLKLIEHLSDTSLLGVCTRSRKDVWWGNHEILDYCETKNIPVIPRSQILNLSVDYLISVLYPFIIEDKYIQHVREKCINLHEAPLPRWRGCNGYSHAIISGDKEYGTTLHEMAAELDAGMIIANKKFPIMPDETAKELYERTSEESYKLAQLWFPKIIQNEYKPYVPYNTEASFLNQRYSLARLKELDIQAPMVDVFHRVRALDFVPWEPAYMFTGNKKFYFFISGSPGRENIEKWHENIQILQVSCLGDIDFGSIDVGIITNLPRSMYIFESKVYKNNFQLIGEKVNSNDTV